jgi:N-acetylglucosamine transport system permease protein
MVFTLIVLLPIIWTFYTSFKTTTEFLDNPWALPKGINIENYKNALIKGNMVGYFKNSFVTTLMSLAFLLILAVPTAYVTARYKFKFSGAISLLFMAGLFVSQNYIVVPIFLMLNKFQRFLNQYVVFEHLEITNNLIVLSVVYAVCSLPFSIYLLSGFLRSIPKEYENAAKIDGCTYGQILSRIIVPMSKPALVTVIMFDFMEYWNEYIMAMTLLSEKKWTVPIGLANLMEQQKFATDWGAMFAGMVIVMLPTMIFYAFVQKKLTEGISLGGLKG